MSFNKWQKLIAASTENAVVVACCEAAVVEETLTCDSREPMFRKPNRAASATVKAGSNPATALL